MKREPHTVAGAVLGVTAAWAEPAVLPAWIYSGQHLRLSHAQKGLTNASLLATMN